MKIQDLPESVTVTLDEDQAVQYPINGDFEQSYELELLCFSKKNYLKTWPLRQRMMDVSSTMAAKFQELMPDMIDSNDEQDTEQSKQMPTADEMRSMCMMGGFDAVAAMEEFKQFAIAGKLIKIDEDVFMNKERWEQLDDELKEEVLFTYLANFIQPCVVQ